MREKKDDFYVVAREWGAENPSIPTWANETLNPLDLEEKSLEKITRVEVEGVPGAFQLLNVLSAQECQSFVQTCEEVGFVPDAAVSLPRSVRHNDSLTWVVDDGTHDIIWERCEGFVPKALGVNKRFRFYKYDEGDYFSLHTDGAWPGSSVENKNLITDFYRDRFSQMTFLLFLSDDFEGGATEFLVDKKSRKFVSVRTPKGGVLCFPHGMNPMHCLHSSQEIISGIKYIIRSDILYAK